MKLKHILMAAGVIAAATFGVSNFAMADETAAAPAVEAEATADAEQAAVDCATLEGEAKTACEEKAAAEGAAEEAPAAEGASEEAPAEDAAH